jgi:hypothetical protein
VDTTTVGRGAAGTAVGAADELAAGVVGLDVAPPAGGADVVAVLVAAAAPGLVDDGAADVGSDDPQPARPSRLQAATAAMRRERGMLRVY